MSATPAKRNQKTEVSKDREVTAFAMHPGSVLAMETWHCHQAEAVFFGERQGRMTAGGRGCTQNRDVTHCIVSWETHPSNRHL